MASAFPSWVTAASCITIEPFGIHGAWIFADRLEYAIRVAEQTPAPLPPPVLELLGHGPAAESSPELDDDSEAGSR